MSDRSFGDHAFRNVVKNPLLSTSVTGLSIEDLTHNAVLLPAVPSQEMSTRRDERSGSQTRALRHSEHEIANLQSGDTSYNIYPPNTLTDIGLSPANTQNTTQNVSSNDTSSVNVSKASAKSDDDFDVNEYFARLQGTRYVSAPLNSVLKEDQNANLQAAEENLEEINLNEPPATTQDVQQSITADIAQNFSQLPTVLPQMASVVFNSFSNMLSLKSREQTPEESKGVYQDANVRPAEPNPHMGVPDIVKDVAPPPLKEPPVVGTGNYRITTRKKVYAQIPGLSTNETAQPIPYQPPINQPNYFVPDVTAGYTADKEAKNDYNNAISANDNDKSVYDVFGNSQVDGTTDRHSEQVNLQSTLSQAVVTSQIETIAPPLNTAPGSGPIPPPPVSSYSKKEQTAVGKSVLPPSVARRISANQPIIKSQPPSMQVPHYGNIFVPQSTPEIPGVEESKNTQAFSATVAMSLPISTTDLQTSLPEKQTEFTPGLPPSFTNMSQNIPSQTGIFPPPSSAINMSTIHSQTEIKPTSQPSIPQTAIPFTSNVLPPIGSLPPTTVSSQEPIKKAPVIPPPIKPSMLPPPPTSIKTSESVIGTQIADAKPVYPTPHVTQTMFASANLTQENVQSNPDQQNISTPPMFFNPVSPIPPQPKPLPATQVGSTQQDVTQLVNPNDVPPATKALVPEPPRSQGVTNYRMTKKRPQYYSGPIEGVGSISNNIKPVFNPVQAASYHGSLFTPQEPVQPLTQSEPSFSDTGAGQIPFDSFTMPPISNHNYGTASTVPQNVPQNDYNTAFDFSRPTTDRYEPPQETSGFGLIGSLKSKLSSIDIGKIQDTVTTFFDPAFNVKAEESNTQGNFPSSQHTQDQSSCLEMLVVPSPDPQPPYNYQANYQSIPSNSYSTYEFNPSTSQQTYQNINYQAVPQTYNALENRMESVTHNSTYQQVNLNTFSTNEHILLPPTSQQRVQDHQDTLQSTCNVQKSQPEIASQKEIPNIEETDHSSHGAIKNDVLQSSSQQSNQNFNTQATPQNYFSFIESNRTETASDIHSIHDQATAQSYHVDSKHDLSQTSQNVQHKLEDKNNLNSQLKQDKDFFAEQTNVGKEQTAEDLADFDEERFNETRAAIEALVKAFLPEEPKPKPKEEPLTGPGFIISMGPIDDSVDPDSIYTRVISSEPLTKEQHQKAYQELMNRPINIFDGDEQSHIIEPDSKPSTPEIPKKKEKTISSMSTIGTSYNTNVIEPAPPVTNIDYGFNSDYASQYFSDNNATQIFSSALKHDSSSDNTGSDSIRYFIPYKASQKELEMVARLGDMSLDTDYDVSTENSSALHCEEEDASYASKKEETKETIDVTKQLIENITAPIQLSNPVEVPLPEPSRVIDDSLDFSSDQFAEISHITEETIETIQVQSATELLQDANVNDTVFKNYIWCTDDGTSPLRDHSYTLNPEPNAMSHIPNTSMFFDNVLTNASDELKAECKHSLDEHHILPRQMSIPSAPPAEDSNDEGVLDVQSIEQDAKKDFMFIHEMVIEPETDDSKIKELERTSDDHAQEIESFANRIDKFKKHDGTTGDENDEAVNKAANTNKSYPSYFDTGNFAADNHYKNAPNSSFLSFGPSNMPMRIPPGFEQEYYRKCNISNLQNERDDVADANKNENVPQIPETTTQTVVTETVTMSGAKSVDSDKVETSSDKINALVEQFIEQKREIKPRPMKSKSTFGSVPLAHTLGTDPEEIWELVGHQVSYSPPLPSKHTDEMTRARFMAHLRHSPVGGEGNDNTVDPRPDASLPNVADGNLRINEPMSGARFSALHYDENRTRRRSRETNHPQDIMEALRENETDDVYYIDPSNSQTNLGTTYENVSLRQPEEALPAVEHREETTNIVTRTEITSSLPDPMSFFSEPSTSNTEANRGADDREQGFSRLSSYFAAPPTTKQDPTKSFFELSQSQNHYRQNQPNHTHTQIIQQSVDRFFGSTMSNAHSQVNQSVQNAQNIPRNTANMNLIRELTSAKNFTPPNVVTTANYFTVHYDYETVINSTIGEPDRVNINQPKTTKTNQNDITEPTKLGELGETVDTVDDTAIVNACKHCCDFTSGRIVKLDFENVDLNGKVKKFMDGNTDTKKGGDNVMEETADVKRKYGHTVNFDTDSLQEDPNEAVSMMSENRSSSEYSPVKYHWFYRVDVEGKSVWRGFSVADSRALERSFHSPDLNENTLVPTDGGRFDVNVVARLRIAVYWADKPTNVRRCSWFYKGTTDARYVPYTEQVAEKLEEEYRHGMTTGEWHRRLMLPNNETVVMHGPAVMVHLLQTGSDALNSSPLFSFGKRVYRNIPKIRVSPEQRGPIDHLLLLVHGAGEFGHQRDKTLAWDVNNQSMMRPRVVRRGHVESEIEDTEPSSIDHLLLLCHGVGSACDMRFRAVEEVVDDFRATSLQLLQSHYRNSYDNGLVGRVEVLPISWHASLHSCETGVDRRLAAVTLDSIPRLRSFTNDTILDVLFYTSPVYCQHIMDTVCGELNRIYGLFKLRNPDFKGGVSLGGHSLGSVILYDLLCHQTPNRASTQSPGAPGKQYVAGGAGTGQPTVKYPPLEFRPDALYALGSPIAIFECIRGVETLGREFCLPTCRNFFNIFHPYDPIAYRIEPMINPDLRDVKPQLIPHHKGRKRMHLELKDTMARVGADIKQKIIESIKSTWSSVWPSPPPPHAHLEKVVEEEMEKEESDEERKEEANEHATASPDMLGKLNAGRRIDYVLQEAPFEMINEYLFAMRSHVCYWESEDTMLLILREIYDALGVQPDCSVPQRTLTVHRARVLDDETLITPGDSPSTSRDS